MAVNQYSNNMCKWKDVPGWEEAYQVSTQGEVRSKDRLVYTKNAHGVMGFRRFKGRVLRPGTLKKGYLMVTLTGPGRPRRYVCVHTLVLAAFRGPVPRGKECCHGNGVRSDNRLANLRYGTRSENAQDRKQNGVPWLKGEQCGSAKLTEADVKWIRAHEAEVSMRKMGKRFGVAHGTIKSVLTRETWGHVNGRH